MDSEDAGMTMHPHVMPPAQQAVLRELGPLATEADFYLGGGTAAAVQIGHRRSVDLDWFTNEAIPDPLRLAARLQGQQFDLSVDSVEAGTLHGESDGVLLSFLEYRYPLLEPPAEWAGYGCRLASLADLACMKLSAIAGRGTKKDFIDVFALGRSGLGLGEMLDLYKRKFSIRDIGHVVMSLTYFDDADAEDMPTMLWDVGWSNVKQSIERWVTDYTRHPHPPPEAGAR